MILKCLSQHPKFSKRVGGGGYKEKDNFEALSTKVCLATSYFKTVQEQQLHASDLWLFFFLSFFNLKILFFRAAYWQPKLTEKYCSLAHRITVSLEGTGEILCREKQGTGTERIHALIFAPPVLGSVPFKAS